MIFSEIEEYDTHSRFTFTLKYAKKCFRNKTFMHLYHFHLKCNGFMEFLHHTSIIMLKPFLYTQTKANSWQWHQH